MADEVFEDLLATLRWGAELPLTREQRVQVKDLCCKIAGISGAGGSAVIPSYRLKEEINARRAAEQRVRELEAELANRKWWQRI